MCSVRERVSRVSIAMAFNRALHTPRYLEDLNALTFCSLRFYKNIYRYTNALLFFACIDSLSFTLFAPTLCSEDEHRQLKQAEAEAKATEKQRLEDEVRYIVLAFGTVPPPPKLVVYVLNIYYLPSRLRGLFPSNSSDNRSKRSGSGKSGSKRETKHKN